MIRPAPEPTGLRRITKPSAENWRVLVVEDDCLQADWLCDLLEGEGIEPVGPAADAKTAQRLLETVSIDAGILDIRLQEGLCFDVARTLEERGIPFLFLTGSTGEVIPEKFHGVPLLVVKGTAGEAALAFAIDGG